MKNKKLLVTILVGVMTIVVVNAGLMTYFGQVSATVTAEQPISFTVDGDDYTGKSFAESVECDAGDTCKSIHNFEISNSASESRTIKISEYSSSEGVKAIYEVCVASCFDSSGVCVWTPIPANNVITIAPECHAYFDISYNLNRMLESGDYTVETKIEPYGVIIVPA